MEHNKKRSKKIFANNFEKGKQVIDSEGIAGEGARGCQMASKMGGGANEMVEVELWEANTQAEGRKSYDNSEEELVGAMSCEQCHGGNQLGELSGDDGAVDDACHVQLAIPTGQVTKTYRVEWRKPTKQAANRSPRSPSRRGEEKPIAVMRFKTGHEGDCKGKSFNESNEDGECHGQLASSTDEVIKIYDTEPQKTSRRSASRSQSQRNKMIRAAIMYYETGHEGKSCFGEATEDDVWDNAQCAIGRSPRLRRKVAVSFKTRHEGNCNEDNPDMAVEDSKCPAQLVGSADEDWQIYKAAPLNSARRGSSKTSHLRKKEDGTAGMSFKTRHEDSYEGSLSREAAKDGICFLNIQSFTAEDWQMYKAEPQDNTPCGSANNLSLGRENEIPAGTSFKTRHEDSREGRLSHEATKDGQYSAKSAGSAEKDWQMYKAERLDSAQSGSAKTPRLRRKEEPSAGMSFKMRDEDNRECASKMVGSTDKDLQMNKTEPLDSFPCASGRSPRLRSAGMSFKTRHEDNHKGSLHTVASKDGQYSANSAGSKDKDLQMYKAEPLDSAQSASGRSPRPRSAGMSFHSRHEGSRKGCVLDEAAEDEPCSSRYVGSKDKDIQICEPEPQEWTRRSTQRKPYGLDEKDPAALMCSKSRLESSRKGHVLDEAAKDEPCFSQYIVSTGKEIQKYEMEPQVRRSHSDSSTEEGSACMCFKQRFEGHHIEVFSDENTSDDLCDCVSSGESKEIVNSYKSKFWKDTKRMFKEYQSDSSSTVSIEEGGNFNYFEQRYKGHRKADSYDHYESFRKAMDDGTRLGPAPGKVEAKPHNALKHTCVRCHKEANNQELAVVNRFEEYHKSNQIEDISDDEVEVDLGNDKLTGMSKEIYSFYKSELNKAAKDRTGKFCTDCLEAGIKAIIWRHKGSRLE